MGKLKSKVLVLGEGPTELLEFFETHRCTELFFLYYFLTSTAKILCFSYRLIINHIRYDVRIFG